jgi:hypothetical protein
VTNQLKEKLEDFATKLAEELKIRGKKREETTNI